LIHLTKSTEWITIAGKKEIMMDFMVCAYGEPREKAFIPYVEKYVAGVELQNYDRQGVVSGEAWAKVLEQHKSILSVLPGRLAVHGPFAGIEYGYKDHLLNEAVRKRMHMIYEMVCELKPDTLILHTGCSETMVRFSLTEDWLEAAGKFWRDEIARYAAIGVRVVLENVAEQSPDSMIELAERVKNEHFGLCLDIGHANLCSQVPPCQWVKKMGPRLKHVHLHDNHGQSDQHLPVGKGSIDFDPFFEALNKYVPEVTVSIEVIAEPQAVVENVIYITKKYQ
jgi:sugar phosphate isomerase/epimerase